MDFVFEYKDDEGRRLVVDDDGSAAYAYLILPENQWVASVWLYNRATTPPLDEEWERPFRDGTVEAPLNAQPYVVPGFDPPSDRDFSVAWHPEIRSVGIHIRGELHAVLEEFERVGRCRLARKDGPLALTMPVEGWTSAGVRGRRFMTTFMFDTFTTLIEADERACYAYLFEESTLLSYVWLYNRVQPQAEPKPRSIGQPGNREPNPASSTGFDEPTRDDFRVIWRGEKRSAAIYIRERLHAVLRDGNRPGTCVLATEANVFAEPLSSPS